MEMTSPLPPVGRSPSSGTSPSPAGGERGGGRCDEVGAAERDAAASGREQVERGRVGRRGVGHVAVQLTGDPRGLDRDDLVGLGLDVELAALRAGVPPSARRPSPRCRASRSRASCASAGSTTGPRRAPCVPSWTTWCSRLSPGRLVRARRQSHRQQIGQYVLSLATPARSITGTSPRPPPPRRTAPPPRRRSTRR